MDYQLYDPEKPALPKYAFFTGKGGVGKTSVACAAAVKLADHGHKTLIVSTDPASNLQDVFAGEFSDTPKEIPEVPNLFVANIDPVEAAKQYRERIVAPYRGVLPDAAIKDISEQLSGSCTVEIAAFNRFAEFLTDAKTAAQYDHVIFDTAPTGHTLRLLQLPAAWNGFIAQSKHGASCLGQLSGLGAYKNMYAEAVRRLSDPKETALILVSRAEETPLKEAARSAAELQKLGIAAQRLVINGLARSGTDPLSQELFLKQSRALQEIPAALKELETAYIPLRGYGITGPESMRALLTSENVSHQKDERLSGAKLFLLSEVADDLIAKKRKVIFTMGKGGTGKTTVAATLALSLAEHGKKVLLATTDPAAHLKYVIKDSELLMTAYIDERLELAKYREEVLAKARETGAAEADLDYIKEDLRSPCTQEIAVFRAFAAIVEQAEDRTVIIDTAPTGHALLLLDASQSYEREVQRSENGSVPESVKKLLPRLRSEDTEVLIMALPEMTPVCEALRLEQDLRRAGVHAGWRIINSSFAAAVIQDPLLKAKAAQEIRWINQLAADPLTPAAIVPWLGGELKGEGLRRLLQASAEGLKAYA